MIPSARVLSVYAQTMARPWPRLLPTFKAWLLSTCLFIVFQYRRNFNFMACFEVLKSTVPFNLQFLLIRCLLWNMPEHSDTSSYVQNKLM